MVALCDGGSTSFFADIAPVLSTGTIDGSEDWKISFGNVRQLINHDDTCWGDPDSTTFEWYNTNPDPDGLAWNVWEPLNLVDVTSSATDSWVTLEKD